MPKPATPPEKILKAAIAKTDQVQEDLQDAATALGDASAILSGPVSQAQNLAAVADAVEQNLAGQGMVQDAANDLETVKELIVQAQDAQAAGEASRKSGAGTANMLAYFEGRRDQVRDDEAAAGKA